MRVEVMKHYGLEKPLNQAGYCETSHHKELMKDVRGAIIEGRLIAICGVIGSGKTLMLRHLEQQLPEEKKVIVSKSVAEEKHNIRLATLVEALFYDLTPGPKIQIPKGIEKRDRQLQELIHKKKRPIALFVDEAHDLNGNTLIGLKRLMELAEADGSRLSVVLAGHPKLRNDLRRETMEEIGYRTDVFSLDGIAGSQREYIEWLLASCTDGKVSAEDILTADAIDLLAERLRTPLQIQLYLALALDAGYQAGAQPVTADVVESVLTGHLNRPGADADPTWLQTERPGGAVRRETRRDQGAVQQHS